MRIVHLGTRCAPGDRRVERRERVAHRFGTDEARDGSRVTRGAARHDTREHHVAVAIGSERHDALRVAARRALVPGAARAREVVHLTRCERALDRLAIGVRDHEHHAARGILRHDGDEAAVLVVIQSGQIKHVHPSSVPVPRSSRDSTATP